MGDFGTTPETTTTGVDPACRRLPTVGNHAPRIVPDGRAANAGMS